MSHFHNFSQMIFMWYSSVGLYIIWVLFEQWYSCRNIDEWGIVPSQTFPHRLISILDNKNVIFIIATQFVIIHTSGPPNANEDMYSKNQNTVTSFKATPAMMYSSVTNIAIKDRKHNYVMVIHWGRAAENTAESETMFYTRMSLCISIQMKLLDSDIHFLSSSYQ